MLNGFSPFAPREEDLPKPRAFDMARFNALRDRLEGKPGQAPYATVEEWEHDMAESQRMWREGT